jgi:hypothetical protein
VQPTSVHVSPPGQGLLLLHGVLTCSELTLDESLLDESLLEQPSQRPPAIAAGTSQIQEGERTGRRDDSFIFRLQ